VRSLGGICRGGRGVTFARRNGGLACLGAEDVEGRGLEGGVEVCVEGPDFEVAPCRVGFLHHVGHHLPGHHLHSGMHLI